MKICNGCKAELPESNFGYKNKSKKWLRSKCKRCWYEIYLEKYKFRHRYKRKPKDTKKIVKPREEILAYHRERMKKYYRDNSYKGKARTKANYHVDITGKKCCFCGCSEKLERHHSDYSKPLLITVLCKKCHTALHKTEKSTT